MSLEFVSQNELADHKVVEHKCDNMAVKSVDEATMTW